jgi:hypothetical protein
VAFFYRNKAAATELIKGYAGEYAFCQDCEACQTCDKTYGKVHPIASYVYRYLMDIEAGFKIYPGGRSWEYEPDWFISLLTAAQNELHSIQSEEAKGNK